MKLKDININKDFLPVQYEKALFDIIGNKIMFHVPSPENNGFYFCCVEWVSNDADKDQWTEETDIEIFCSGWAAFDGIRHLYFGNDKTDNEGYFNYPNLNELKTVVEKLIELQNKYCSDFK